MSDLVENPEDRFSHNEAHLTNELPIVDSSSSTVGDSCILMGVPWGGGDIVPGSISRSLSESWAAKSSDIRRLGTLSVKQNNRKDQKFSDARNLCCNLP